MYKNNNDEVYEAPSLAEVGSLEELTLQEKQIGQGDGFTFQGQPIRNVT